MDSTGCRYFSPPQIAGNLFKSLENSVYTLFSLSRNNKSPFSGAFIIARETGLEPATSAVTGQRSNQLSYSRKYISFKKLRWQEYIVLL